MSTESQPLQILTDVIELSKSQCQFPIFGKLAYASDENFLGRIVDGYSADADDICLLTKKTAHALCQVQNDLNQQQLGLFIFDAYRPHRAVRDFAKWFNSPSSGDYELIRKALHYPHLNKSDLALLGYVHGGISNHNFGNTVDLALISIKDCKLLDMGTIFDFFDDLSHYSANIEQIGSVACHNRLLLSKAMQQHNFAPYEKEYWHFSFYKREIETPMDLPILAQYKNLNAKQA